MIPALLFVISGLVLLSAATRLTVHAESIAERTGLGRIWIGTILLGAATSLPELGTDVAAVRFHASDIAAGDLFGSTMANMLILAIIDLLPPRRGVLKGANVDHALSASVAICLTAMGGMFVLAGGGRTVSGVGIDSILLLVFFIGGTRIVYRHKREEPPALPLAPDAGSTQPGRSLRGPALSFLGAAAVILAVAPLFAYSAREIAVLTGLGQTFTGTWLVGLSTSVPELVSSVAAVRMGAFDLAVGNLFGSNAFNMTIFFAMDLAHPGGSIFATLNPEHALSALCGIVLMSLGLGAVVFRSEKRWAGIEPDCALIIAAYVASMALLYARRIDG